jgi:integrase
MPKRIGLPFQEWPTQDQQAWTASTSATSYFAAEARFAHWAQETRRRAESAFGRWLAFLKLDAPAALSAPATERITPEALEQYCTTLQSRMMSAMGIANELHHLTMAVRAVAPAADVAPLRRLQQAFARRARTREHRAKIIDARRIYALGFVLMDSAIQEPRVAVARLDFRDGLMIALLISCAIRRRTLGSIEIGKHLLETQDGGFDLQLPGSITKTHTPLEFEVPRDLAPYVQLFLTKFRPLFRGATSHAHLWPSVKGGPLAEDAIYRAISKRTFKAFQEAISPHPFREIAATTLIQASPQHTQMASDLLGHSNPHTTDRFYRRAKSLEASRIYGTLTVPSSGGTKQR